MNTEQLALRRSFVGGSDVLSSSFLMACSGLKRMAGVCPCLIQRVLMGTGQHTSVCGLCVRPLSGWPERRPLIQINRTTNLVPSKTTGLC